MVLLTFFNLFTRFSKTGAKLWKHFAQKMFPEYFNFLLTYLDNQYQIKMQFYNAEYQIAISMASA
jgi:hypothetical protein